MITYASKVRVPLMYELSLKELDHYKEHQFSKNRKNRIRKSLPVALARSVRHMWNNIHFVWSRGKQLVCLPRVPRDHTLSA